MQLKDGGTLNDAARVKFIQIVTSAMTDKIDSL